MLEAPATAAHLSALLVSQQGEVIPRNGAGYEELGERKQVLDTVVQSRRNTSISPLVPEHQTNEEIVIICLSLHCFFLKEG